MSLAKVEKAVTVGLGVIAVLLVTWIGVDKSQYGPTTPSTTTTTVPVTVTTVPPSTTVAPTTTSTTALPEVTATTTQTGSSTLPPYALVSYTVQPGDTLTSIASWFSYRGYGQLFDQNKTAIGSNPNYIQAGQVLTIWSSGQMTSGKP